MTGISGSGNRVPDYRREIDGLKAEIRKLWLALGRPADEQVVNGEQIYSWAGIVYPGSGRTSGPWVCPFRVTITRLTIGVRSTSSGAVTAAILVDGIQEASFSLPAGSPRASELIAVDVDPNVPVQILITGASGAQDLTVALGYVKR